MTRYTLFDPQNPPPSLLTSEPDSFARRTIATRKPSLVDQVLADHNYSPEIVADLQTLRDELAFSRPVQPLLTIASDGPAWNAAWQQQAKGKTWLDIPWYFAETFFYRRLLEAAGYFSGNSTKIEWQGVDPFLPQKKKELRGDTPWQVLLLALRHSANDSDDSFRTLLHHCVWGNRVDLSYNKVAEDAGRQITIDSEQENLLADDTEIVLAHLNGQRDTFSSPLQFICDNTGTELLLDLALADFFLRFDWAQRVTLHVKHHPMFVSDATPVDVKNTITAIKNRPEPELEALGNRLENYRKQKRLPVHEDIFWNNPKFFWEMPPHLNSELAGATLVFIKGDANYRRLYGDSPWPADTPVANAAPYFPAPFVTLRTMKSPVVLGLRSEQVEALQKEDSQWRVNGKRGVIQALL